MYETYYRKHSDLASLPWFETRNGRLYLEASLGFGIMDVHTHLALTYIRHKSVDLWRSHERTRHYLPFESPVDLNLYANRNFSKEDIERMKGDLTWKALTCGGMRATHTAANLLAEMSDLGISNAAVHPIEMPVASYNSENFIEAAKRTDRLISFGSVHPLSENKAGKIKKLKEIGAKGIKLHPAIQMLPPDHQKYMEIYDECGKQGLPVIWHCGPVGIEPKIGRYCSQVKHYWRPVLEFPQTVFILGHSGALQCDMAIDLAGNRENVYLDLSCQGIFEIKKIIREASPDRILFGTDWPFYHQGPPLAKVLIATDGNEIIREKILWGNAADLLKIKATDK